MNIFKWFEKKESTPRDLPESFTQRIASGAEMTMDNTSFRVLAPDGTVAFEVRWTQTASGEFGRLRAADGPEDRSTLVLYGPVKGLPRAAIGNP